MSRILICWVGRTDLRARSESDKIGIGPIAQALLVRQFDQAFLLSDYPEKEVKPYVKWLSERSKVHIELLLEKLSGPMNFGEIYEAAVRACEHVLEAKDRETVLTFHLSPGTPAMAAVWILIGKTRFPAELIQSSPEHGVQTADIPFHISAEFIPDLLRQQDERLREKSASDPPDAPEFRDIVHRSRGMVRLVHLAQKLALRNVPVLIEGESGTGKEMLARAIHRASLRGDKPFVAVNCGAIPADLIESELFGHEKGAFTGATATKKGYFESANAGTLFLDELGELPHIAQVKLLRVLQEGEVVHLGATKSLKIDVRIIAATNRTMIDEIACGRFREDLFYRLAVAMLKIPPLRERTGDVGILIDYLLGQVNREAAGEPGFKDKKLSAGARNLLLSHLWPGNVRELLNTLHRAAIWSEGTVISTDDAREALMPPMTVGKKDIVGRPLGEGLNLPDLIGEVARHYLERAITEAHGNKTKAAELVGLPSHQTLSNWLARYNIH
jgi:transcriptional regulator with PAS, ATPase and Fis domain